MTEKTPMTAEDFAYFEAKLLQSAIEAEANAQGRIRTLARLILVEGKTLTAASQEVGMSKQLANHHMKRVKALLNDQPADWVLFSEWMPPLLAAETRQKLNTEKKKIKK